ncbi:hypothetical protein [Butyrivibrio sp. JL13D10]|uniref:hypothetical protein n=1 Tax=Butyrivibrio sp. JL13D10 TaxID=3236815 RepID=UPI0038B440E5
MRIKKALAVVISASMMPGIIGCGAKVKAASATTASTKAESASTTDANTKEDTNSNKNVDTDEIPGNGRHFVQYNGHLYFRIPSEDSMNASAIWGTYDEVENSAGTIVAMDCETLETENLFEDMSQGPIVISGNRLILGSNSTTGQHNVRSISLEEFDSKSPEGSGSKSPEGSASKSLEESDSADLPGTYIYGTQPSGKYFITGGFNSDDHKLHLYICDEEGNYIEPDTSNRLFDYATIGKTQLFCITKEDEESYSISGFDLTTGKETVYGEIPQMSETEAIPCKIRQFIEEDGNAYLQLSFYKGKEQKYKGSSYARLKVGKAGSLEGITPDETFVNSKEERLTPSIMLKNGKLTLVKGRPDVASLDVEGYIGFYNENGEFVQVAPGYETAYTDKKRDTRMAVEVVEAAEGYIYVVQNKECRVPEDDDGLRYAYRRMETWFKRIDEKTGDTEIISHIVNPTFDKSDIDESDNDKSDNDKPDIAESDIDKSNINESNTDKADNNKSDTDKADMAKSGETAMEKALTRDSLKGLVRNDILKRFRAFTPYRQGSSVEDEALRLGFWVKDSIGSQMPESIKEHGESIGQKYEFYFGTDIGNNFNDNFPRIYQVYFTLKDYYINGRNKEFYNSVLEDNSYLGDGNPQTIKQMYEDLKVFITDCNNFIRRKK